MTLSEARKINSQCQKGAIIKFVVNLVLIAAALCCLLFFTEYLKLYKGLYAIFVVLVLLAGKYSKIYLFIQPKEFIGKVEYSNIKMEPVKKYASHQAGVSYASSDVAVLEIIAVNEKGRKLSKTVAYNWNWGEYLKGSRVVFLRFIQQPILYSDEQ